MSFLVRHRLPNFAGGDCIHPDELEHKEIQKLSELEDFDFIKHPKSMGLTRTLIVEVPEEEKKYCSFDYYICVENPDDLKSRTWVGKLKEYDPQVDDPWRF